jgi:hypothetical protein
MPLSSIQMPGAQVARGPSTLEQIAQGVDIASKVLGTGMKAYEIFGIDRPNSKAYQAKNNAETEKDQAQTNFINQGGELGGSYMEANDPNEKGAHHVPGLDPDTYYVPTKELGWEAAANMHEGVKDAKRNQQEMQAFIHANNEATGLRGNIAIRNAGEVMRLVQNARAIVAPYGNNLDQMPTSQVELLNEEIGKIAKAGSPTEHDMQQISDPTLYKDYAKFVSYVQNKAQGAGQEKFIPNKIRYLNDLENNAETLIRANNEKVVKKWEPHMNPLDAKNMRDSLDNFLQTMKGVNAISTTSGPDNQAVLIAPPAKQFDPDVLDYAQKHNISPDQADAIKRLRMGGQ